VTSPAIGAACGSRRFSCACGLPAGHNSKHKCAYDGNEWTDLEAVTARLRGLKKQAKAMRKRAERIEAELAELLDELDPERIDDTNPGA
jgi:hypothetical protein